MTSSTKDNDDVISFMNELHVDEGMMVAAYYMDKAQAIEDYYGQPKNELSKDTESIGSAQNEPKPDLDQSIDPSILPIVEQGRAIHRYYHASFDPVSYQHDIMMQWKSLLEHDPNLIYPPWGFDWRIDREHGIAIGNFWHMRHKLERQQYWQVQGKDLTAYYRDFYEEMLTLPL